jgi:triacylglycerol lipase
MCVCLPSPIVLAHGLFGFDQLRMGPLRLSAYFRGIPEWLAAQGNRVVVTRVPPISGLDRRARHLGKQIQAAFPGEPVHIIGHSFGGLDARWLLADPAWSGRVLSLTTIGTPHLGSALADFAKLRLGRIYDQLQRLGVDLRGFHDVTRRSARAFHRRTPAPGDVACFSVAGDPSAEDVCWPLRRLHAALTELEGPNDGLVSVESAVAFGTPLTIRPIDHLRQMNWLSPEGPARLGPSPALGLYAEVLENLASHGFGVSGERGGREIPASSTP